MTKVLAAVDAGAAARPVLATASALGRLLGAEVEAVHAGKPGAGAARAQAEAAGVPMRLLAGSAVSALTAAAGEPDVIAIVLGARGTPGGRRPAGRTALEVISAVPKLVIVVPPDVLHPGRLERVLVPLDGTTGTARALKQSIELALGAGLEIVVLHVYGEEALPPFDDQTQHETRSWREEFLARYCPYPTGDVRLELRVGVPPDQVLRVAAEEEADLIALGWESDLSAGRAAVVRHAVAESKVPVLLVPVAEPGERVGVAQPLSALRRTM